MKVIFLDIDGVLNSQKYLINNYERVIKFYNKYGKDVSDINLLLERQMLDINIDKVKLLKEIIDFTGTLVVIISSWKKLKIYPYVVGKLISMGIPIIGQTMDNGDNRGTGIKKYLNENNITNYVILDDEIFKDYDQELISRLVKTSFYDDGIKMEHKKEIIKKLNRKK